MKPADHLDKDEEGDIKDGMRSLREIQPRRDLQREILARMKEEGRSQSLWRKPQLPWWRRRVSVPIPAIGLALLLVCGMGWHQTAFWKPDSTEGAVAPIIVTPSATPLPSPVQKATDAAPKKVFTRREVATYIPTVGYISRSETLLLEEE